MTQLEDSVLAEPKQVPSLCIELPLGLQLDMPDTRANRRAVMIFLRGLRAPDGRPLVTYEHIAKELGYADRRNVHNFCAEFTACGDDMEAFLQRRKKVDREVVELCEQVWKAHPLWSCAQVHAEIKQHWPEIAEGLSENNIRTAGRQVGFLSVQQTLRRQVAEGQAHYKEERLLETLFAFALAAVDQAPQATRHIPEVLEQALPIAAPTPEIAHPGQKAALLEDQLLSTEASPQALERLWNGTQGILMLIFMLYYHGISLEVLGQLFGVHKTTVMRWIAPLAEMNWRSIIEKGGRYCSGVVAVDEKWVKIEGVWWYLFAAVDHVSGMPLHVTLFPCNNGAYCHLFLLQLKQLGYRPHVFITDGWDGYVKAIAQVFPGAEHLLCRFHALKATFRRLRQALGKASRSCTWAAKLSRVFHSHDKRTVRRRLAALLKETASTPVAGVVARLEAKFSKLLPAVGSTFRPITSNRVEQFFAAFERFNRLKGPYQSEASARKHVALFMLGYVFRVYSADATEAHRGRCPLELAGYEVARIPLFHLLNRPPVGRLQEAMAQRFAQAA